METQKTTNPMDALEKLIKLSDKIAAGKPSIELVDGSIVDSDPDKVTKDTFNRIVTTKEIEEVLVGSLANSDEGRVSKERYQQWLRLFKYIRSNVSGMAASKAHEAEGIWVSLKRPAPKKRKKR